MSTEKPATGSRMIAMVKTILTTLIAIGVLGLFLAWMGGAFHEKVPPGTVAVEKVSAKGRTFATVEKMTGAETISVVGSVQSRKKTDVACQIIANIREIKVRPGDKVKAGDPLVVLDDRELSAQQREATASLSASEADLVTRKSEYERLRNARQSASGAITAEELTRVEGAYRVAESQVRRAKETISRIEILITYTKIFAANVGIVAERYVDPGDLATPGKPILTIYDPNDLELHANVPESIATSITIGQKLTVRIDASNLTTTATVQEIIPQAQQASRSVIVKLALPTLTSNPILPGMFGRVAIQIGQSERLLLPQQAVQKIGQLDLVDVLSEGETLSRRFVRLGREFDGKVEILSGISAGERVALPAR